MRNINYSSKIVNKIGPNFVATKDRKKSILKQKIKRQKRHFLFKTYPILFFFGLVLLLKNILLW